MCFDPFFAQKKFYRIFFSLLLLLLFLSFRKFRCLWMCKRNGIRREKKYDVDIFQNKKMNIFAEFASEKRWLDMVARYRVLTYTTHPAMASSTATNKINFRKNVFYIASVSDIMCVCLCVCICVFFRFRRFSLVCFSLRDFHFVHISKIFLVSIVLYIIFALLRHSWL